MEQSHTQGRSLLLPHYRSDVNTNTAPTYGSHTIARHRTERFHNGHSYSVNRMVHQESRVIPREQRFSYDDVEPKIKQPGHNQTEQARRSRESEMFAAIDRFFQDANLASIRLLYCDQSKRCSSNQQPRLTKKINLCAAHAIVRVPTEKSIPGLLLKKRRLLRLASRAAQEKEQPDVIRMLSRFHGNSGLPCGSSCEGCQRLWNVTYNEKAASSSAHAHSGPEGDLAAPSPVGAGPAISRYSQMAIVPQPHQERTMSRSTQNYVQLHPYNNQPSSYCYPTSSSRYRYYAAEMNQQQQQQQQEQQWFEEDVDYH